MKTGLNGII